MFDFLVQKGIGAVIGEPVKCLCSPNSSFSVAVWDAIGGVMQML
jgi:hypothetical protein